MEDQFVIVCPITTKGMEKSDGTEKRETVGTAEESKRTGKAAPLSAGRQTAAETVSQEKIYG